ncbi:hypothetical protein BKA65DRAFT_427548 [Rhexocercosporidium sp. MPI-PUGE-AT-0058]|nr:hypothetical protein BKA65DRAFT_427548 [Rhexocercosporidium sp. MPI-PUGE-AT-0058]
MAPLPESQSSSLKTYLTSLLSRTPSPSPSANPSTLTTHLTQLTHTILKRASKGLPDPGAGVTEPENVPNKTVFILIGLIGAGFVITGIWFFFWAKNGGFYFRENDWDDYKSTVLRRKGPNGTTLSGATESTDLGGGSVVHGEKGGRSLWGGRKKKGGKRSKGVSGVDRYKDFDEESSAIGTESFGGSTLGSEMGYAAGGGKAKKSSREKTTKPKKVKKAKGAPSDAGTLDTELDVDGDVADAMRAYRHEKPARVGGLNKQPDGSSWDGSNTNDGSTAASELLSYRERTPTSTPTKSKRERKDTYTGGSGTGGIRKVVSTSEGASSFWAKSTGSGSVVTNDERIKAEAKKLQDKGRAAQRRDFSFNVGDDNSTVVSESVSERNLRREERREERERRRKSRSPTKKLPGTYMDEESLMGSTVDGGSEVGTKSYHHPIPGLSSAGSAVGSDYAEERRRKRNAGNGGGGYRRGRRDSLSE